MKRSIIKTLVLVVLILVFAIAFVSPSEAQRSPKPIVLKGTYGVTGQDACVGHWTTPPPGSGSSTYWTKTSVIQGTATFNGDGSGTAEVDQVTIIHPIYAPIPLAPYWGFNGAHIPSVPWDISSIDWLTPPSLPTGSVTTSSISSNFTYVIDPLTRSIRRTVTSSGTFSSGTSAGEDLTDKTFKVTSFQTLGYISLDNQTIIASTPVFNATGGLESQKETVTIYEEDRVTIFSVQEEICHRSRSAVLIK